LVIPQILASGYGWAQKAAATDTLMAIPLWIVLILPLAKIVATSLSIGTGGSGGIFGPGVVIGAFLGAAIWRLGDVVHAPGIPHSPAVFVVVGMMACFGSVAHAPLAVMIMVAEMTGSFSVVPCAMVAVGIAYLLIRRANVSIYRAQRLDRDAVG
jgi:CIC family chloride channel protein